MSGPDPGQAKASPRRRWARAGAAGAVVAVLAAVAWYVTESPKNQIWGPTVTSEPLKQKVVALTYDDGPNPPYTDEIVDILHREGAVATFFVVGTAVQAHPESVRHEIRAGDAVGNHSWDHAHLILFRRSHIRSEISMAEDAIQQATGVRTTLFRPPFGARDFEVIREAREMGLTVVMWSVPLAGDWQGPPPRVIADRVLKYVKDGSIIVLHDGNRGRPGDRANTVAATALIVRTLKEQGYRFVTVPELMRLGYASVTPPPGPTEYGPLFTPTL